MDTSTSTQQMTHDPTPPAPPTPNGWSGFGAAYDRRLAEIQAVPESELVPLNLDVPSAITTVLGALPAISALKNRIANLTDVNQTQIAGLEDYAGAAAEANMRFETATAPPDDIIAMTKAAMKMRETIRIDATSLANRGLVDKNRLSAFKGDVGYKNVGFELLGWASVMHDAWATIQNKTPITVQELIDAKALAEQLIRAAGLREQTPAMVAEAAQIRRQAVTLMIHAYHQTRRAIGYLRWNEGDLETIAPSLYSGRARRTREAPSPEPVPPSPPAPPVEPPHAAAHEPGVAAGLPGAKLSLN